MAFSHGKSSVIAVDDSSGTPPRSRPTLKVSWPQEVEASEVTTFGNGNKAYIVGLADSTVSLSGKYDPTLDALMTSVRAALIAGFRHYLHRQVQPRRDRIGNAALLGGSDPHQLRAVIVSGRPELVERGVSGHRRRLP